MTTEPTASPGDNISNRDIQRWRSPEGYGMFADPHGGYVSVGDAEDQALNAYANGQRDALAAVAAAEQRGYKRGEQDQIDMTRDWGLHQHEVGRLQGQRDALAAERERIEPLVMDIMNNCEDQLLETGVSISIILGDACTAIRAAISGPERTHVTTEGSGGMTSDVQMDEVEQT